MSLLDDLSLTAQVAYSTRLLRSAYTGYCMRVRRTSDSATADIGFDEAGNLDVAAIEAHCGANDGHVAIWYDQSGNGRNQIQSTAGNQPQIWDGDTEEVITMTGSDKPAIFFGGSAPSSRHRMVADFSKLYPYDAFSSAVVFERLASGDYFAMGGGYYSQAVPCWWVDNYIYWFPGFRALGNDDPVSGERLTGSSANTSTGVFDLVSARSVSGLEVWLDGVSYGTYSGDYNNPSWATGVTEMGWGSSPSQGYVSEFITFESTLDSGDADDIHNNAGEWFGYVAPSGVGGEGAGTIPLLTADGDASPVVVGQSGTPSVPTLTAAGSGNPVIRGEGGTPAVPTLTATGTGTQTIGGGGAGIIPTLTGSGVGGEGTITGEGSGLLLVPSAAGAGTPVGGGEGAGTFPVPVGSGVGGAGTTTGEGAGYIPALTATGTGGSLDVTGEGNGLLILPAGSGVGTPVGGGSGGGTLPPFDALGSGGPTVIEGGGTGTFPVPTGSGTGWVDIITGTGTPDIPRITGEGTGTPVNESASAGVLPVLVGAGEGSSVSGATGVAVLPRLTAGVVGASTVHGVWSNRVVFEPGDEWVVTIDGPESNNPTVRASLRFS